MDVCCSFCYKSTDFINSNKKNKYQLSNLNFYRYEINPGSTLSAVTYEFWIFNSKHIQVSPALL